MQTNKDDQVIYVKDLLLSALYGWKRILLFGVILALILGGYKGFSAYRTIQSDKEIPQVSKAPEHTVLEQRLNSLQTTLISLTQYQQESVLMQIDPSDFYKVTLSIYVSTDYIVDPDAIYQPADPAGVILNTYAAVASNEDTVQLLSDALEVKNAYLRELIFTSVDSTTATMTVVVPYPTQEGAQILLDILVQQFEKTQPAIAEVVGEHQLSIYQKSAAPSSDDRLGKDTRLASVQGKNIQTILDLRTSINNTRTALNAVATNPPDVISVRSLIRSAILFAVAGLVLGMFLAVATIWLTHICSSKVYSARTLHNRTQVKVLGSINVLSKQGFILRKLRALDGRSLADKQVQSRLLAANVRNLCAGRTHLLLSGAAECPEFTEALKQAMPNVQLSVCGSLLRDVAAVDALSQCDSVLLIEKCNVSCYADIQQTVSIIEDNNKALLGCILLNG